MAVHVRTELSLGCSGDCEFSGIDPRRVGALVKRRRTRVEFICPMCCTMCGFGSQEVKGVGLVRTCHGPFDGDGCRRRGGGFEWREADDWKYMEVVTAQAFVSAADMEEYKANPVAADPFRAFVETTANIDGGSKGAFRKLMDLKTLAARLLKGNA